MSGHNLSPPKSSTTSLQILALLFLLNALHKLDPFSSQYPALFPMIVDLVTG